MNHRSTLRSTGIAALFLFTSLAHAGAQLAVEHTVGAIRGVLVVRTQAGKQIGYSEFSATNEGDRVTAHMVVHFFDGSLDDETTIFTQGKTFQFVSDHHIQKGRFFPIQTDISIEANGQVTVRTTGKDGKTKVETQHMDLPPDMANGMVGTVLQNISSSAAAFKLGMIVPSFGKGRAIKLDIAPDGDQSFRIAGVKRKATVFRLKPEIGGIAGVIAPIIGKQPPDIFIWVLEGDPPVIVRILEPLSEDTPILSLELAGTAFTRTPAPTK